MRYAVLTLLTCRVTALSPTVATRQQIMGLGSTVTRTGVQATMLDVSVAADAAALSSTTAQTLPTYVYNDPHTLANLGPDMFNSAMVAALGLMGAYVTRVSRA